MVGLTAIVLAAGVNRRLKDTPVPKSMLPLIEGEPGPSFLERHEAVLRESGVDRVQVVLSKSVCERYPSPNGMHVVVNPFDTSVTGSTLSLLCAVRDEEERFDQGLLILDADIVYERALMEWVVGHCDESRLFVTPATTGDDEEVRVYGRNPNTPVLIGKGLRPAMVDGLRLLGESLGVIYVAPGDLQVLRETAEWLSGWPSARKAYGFARDRSEHEEIWQYLFTAGRMSVSQIPSGLLYSECDTPEDYLHVVEHLYPAISARDARSGLGSP